MQPEPYPVAVKNPVRLQPRLEATCTRLAGEYNFKPHIEQLPNGELLLFVAHAHAEEVVTTHTATDAPRALTSHVVLYRSGDGGKTWGQGRHVRELMSGHEPSVSVLDGVVFVIVHIHGSGQYPDPYAERDHSYWVIARSDDGGHTFERTILDETFLRAGRGQRMDGSRNLIQLKDGRLFTLFGAGSAHRGLYSSDGGKSWKVEDVEVCGCRYEGRERAFSAEAVFFQTPGGRLMMLGRVDFAYTTFESELPFDTHYKRETKLDNFDGEVLFESVDAGKTWVPIRAVGFPALMYPSVVHLEGNRMLLTYTVREVPPEGTGCLHPKVGIQAIVFEEQDEGGFDFDFSKDVIVIDDCTPASMRNAGGFGNTLQLSDGTLITPFSYPLIDADILEMADRKEYLKEEVFDTWARMQDTYSWRYRDFVREEWDAELQELHLRRSFSALFLYARCGNKGGIGTAVVRWKI